MARARPLALFSVLVSFCAGDADFNDEQYYSMPDVFGLDGYAGCLATGGTYCLGSFELAPNAGLDLYDYMKKISLNAVDKFNHTRLHRGVCLPRSCADHQPPGEDDLNTAQAWFAACMNASTSSTYGLSARLYHLDYCRRGQVSATPLSSSERGFAGVVATLLALTVVCTVLDLILPETMWKGASWVTSWSLRHNWRTLRAALPASADTDLRAFDGLRVMCMLFVIIEHVCWTDTLAYLADTKVYEEMRWSLGGILLANSTLVVQIFFLMSSFLLAHKLLKMRRRRIPVPPAATFVDTMINRIVRISPSYYFMVWYASSLWARSGHGPLWQPMVDTEAAICRDKWWSHLLYINNIVKPDDKCLIQTWYLAADMQLYAVSLLLTLGLWRLRRGAVYALAALLALSVAAVFALAYSWRLVPTFVIHRAESVRASYAGEASFNVIYQSPLGNLPGALIGLLLAHIHDTTIDEGVDLSKYRWFRWAAVAGAPLSVVWAALSPRLYARGAAALAGGAAPALVAALERPVFAALVAVALLGAMHDVHMPWRTWLSWDGWSLCARLSFGALLLHLPINKSIVASRNHLSQLDSSTAIFEAGGMAIISYATAIPLALLIELPAQRLYKALTTRNNSAKKVNNQNINNNNNVKNEMAS